MQLFYFFRIVVCQKRKCELTFNEQSWKKNDDDEEEEEEEEENRNFFKLINLFLYICFNV